jgi:cytochrome c oxidase assembly protein subunit 15
MYRKSVKIALISVYLVILAGAVVRMTGSGMGCPDWPKCFGHFVPPTERSQLEWHAEQSFHEGQVIIRNESLQVAVSDFVSGKKFNPQNWELYTKHDYAEFNPMHTWTEYINRLFGALAGIAVFVMALISFRKWKTKKRIPLLSWLSVFLMGFQAWLGATVVYSVLEPAKITIHMLMALLIVAVLLYLLYLSKEKTSSISIPKNFKMLLVLCLVLTLVQIGFGTQVRQFVDTQMDVFGYDDKSEWLSNPNFDYYFHRTFSIVVFIANLWLWWINRKKKLGLKLVDWMFLLVVLEILTGILMAYFAFPFSTQSLHLLLATGIFSFQVYLLLEIKDSKVSNTQTQS